MSRFTRPFATLAPFALVCAALLNGPALATSQEVIWDSTGGKELATADHWSRVIVNGVVIPLEEVIAFYFWESGGHPVQDWVFESNPTDVCLGTPGMELVSPEEFCGRGWQELIDRQLVLQDLARRYGNGDGTYIAAIQVRSQKAWEERLKTMEQSGVDKAVLEQATAYRFCFERAEAAHHYLYARAWTATESEVDATQAHAQLMFKEETRQRLWKAIAGPATRKLVKELRDKARIEIVSDLPDEGIYTRLPLFVPYPPSCVRVGPFEGFK